MVETLDNGKPIKETRDFDVPDRGAALLLPRGLGRQAAAPRARAVPRPLGVAGQVIPWNFPLLMAAWKIAPALAAGNTVVIKPAETTPLSILVLAEIIADAGPAAGRGQHRHRGRRHRRRAGQPPGIDKVAFTGSTEVGRRIQSELAGTGRKLTLELGGKGANIVFDDAAIDQAVEGIVNGIFFNQGQVCCAGSRLLVQESIAEEFVDRLQRPGRDAAASATRWTRTPTSARSTPRAQLDRITALMPRPAWPRAPSAGRRPARCPRRGLLLRADDLHRRHPVDADRPGGDLRPGADRR